MVISLSLKNFKTHVNKEIEFPDKGLILLSGPSGAGKSSVFKALLHALYGCISKPANWNATNYEIILNIKNQEIKRTKGKNAVWFNKIDGKAAQAEIEKYFGMNKDEFLASSYIAQKNANSLLTLPPAEQLNFIERLAFGENNPEKYKIKIMATISKAKSDIELLNNEIASLLEIEKDIKPSSEEEYIVDYSKPIKLAEAELKKSNYDLATATDFYKNYTKDMNRRNEQKTNLLKIDTQIQQKTIQCAELDVKVKDLQSEISEIKNIPSESTIKDLRDAKELNKYLEQMKEVQEKISILEEKVKSEAEVLNQIEGNKQLIKDINLMIMSVSEQIATFQVCDKVREKYVDFIDQNIFLKVVDKSITKNEQTITALKNRISAAEDAIQKTEKAIISAKQSQVFGSAKTCPKCKTSLILKDGCLREHISLREDMSEIVIKSLEEQKIKYKKLQEQIREATNILEKIFSGLPVSLEKYEELSLNAAELGKRLEESRTSLSDRNAELERLNNTKTLIEENKKTLKESLGLENSLQVTINVTLGRNSKLISVIKENEGKNIDKTIESSLLIFHSVNSLTKRIEETKQQLETVRKSITELHDQRKQYTVSFDVSPSELSLMEVSEDLEEARCNAVDSEKALVSLVNKKNQQEHNIKSKEEAYKSYNAISEKIRIAKWKQEEALKTLKLSTKLKEISDISQTQSIDSVINSLNMAAQSQENALFPEYPMTAQLKTTKENKDGSVKPKISFAAQYKGVEINNLEDFSGGEDDRLVLAFQLALNSLYNSPLLLLDESFTGLNEELVNLAIDNLKSLAQDKLVIVISHNVNHGEFDQVIEI